MKSRLPIVALLLLILPFSAHAAEIQARSSIVSVVVYPDRAQVTRSAEVQLTQGEHVVLFSNLPSNIDPASLQVKGQGQAGVRLFSTEARKVVLEQARSDDIARLEAEIQGVRDEMAAADARLADLKAEDDLVHSIGVYTGEQFSKEFITREPKPEDWKAMVEFQQKQMARISDEILQTGIHKRELNRRLDALLRQLAELQGQNAKESFDVSVSLSASSGGPFQLLLSYVIFGASWRPSYEARADVRSGQVQFTAVGNVRQSTGEDWKDVELSLSTARPAIGAVMPELHPWYLRPRPPIVEAETSAEKMAQPLRMAMPAAGVRAKPVVAEIVAMGTSVQYEIPYKLDIPSDNAYHRATILADNLKAEFSYAATPKLSPFAYLIAKTVNTTGAYWLAGKAAVFVDGTMTGTESIETVAPNEEVTLGFGTDEGITVEREELARKEEEAKIFGNRKERRFKDRLTIVNHKSEAVALQLIDQIPVSQHGDIKVGDIKFSEKPAERDSDTGIVKWDLRLSPNEKKEIVIEFAVSYPADMIIIGM